MRKAFLAAGMALFCVGTAMAGELAVVKRDDVLTDGIPRWAGAYFGTAGGYTFGKAIDRPYSQVFYRARAEDPVTEVKGASYGGYAGVNWQTEHLVYGLEFGFNGSSVDGTWHAEAAPGFEYAMNEVNHELNWFGGLSGRAGYASGRMLYYALAGIVLGNETTTFPSIYVDSWGSKSTNIGWTLGGGVEYAINDYLSTRVEFSHVDFVMDADKDLYFDTVRFGVTYKMAQ